MVCCALGAKKPPATIHPRRCLGLSYVRPLAGLANPNELVCLKNLHPIFHRSNPLWGNGGLHDINSVVFDEHESRKIYPNRRPHDFLPHPVLIPDFYKMKTQDSLRAKLEVFIRKYYQNRLIKGVMYGIGLGLAYFFLVALAEYFGRFGTGARLVLFWSLMIGLAAIVGVYILYPLSQLLKIGRRISYEKAAQIIGTHFPEVDDKILNTLQLQKESTDDSLLRASIEQKTAQLNPVPFGRAVNFGENKKYWPILVIPALVFVGIFVSGFWKDFSESGKRLAAYNTEFVPEAPFDFVLENENLTVEQGEDLRLNLAFAGNSLPAEASILLPSGESRMTRDAEGNFKFNLENLQKDVEFRFSAAGFSSKTFTVKVLPVPRVRAFTLRVSPPRYTGIPPFETEAKLTQDVPEGSNVEWSLNTERVNSAHLIIGDKKLAFNKLGNQDFSFSKNVRNDFKYAVETENEFVSKTSMAENRVRVIQDAWPEIRADFYQDSTLPNAVYFSGNIRDDYGFSNLSAVVELGSKKYYEKISFQRDVLSQRMGGGLNLDSLAGKADGDVKIYIEVSDNDGVNGAKTRRSQAFSVKMLSREEQKEQLSQEYSKYFRDSEKLEKEQEKLSEALEKLLSQMRDSKKLDYKEKSKIKELLKKQDELLKKQAENEKRLEKLQKDEEKLGEKKEEIKEKEEQIDKLKTEEEKEMEKLMEEIQQLMEKLDMEKLQQKMQEFQQKQEQQQQENERQNDLLKDLQFQKDVLEQAEKMEELSKKMEELSKEDESEKSSEQESEEQKKVEEEFENAAEKIDELRKENEQFDKEAEKENLDQEKQEASEEMQKSQQNLQRQKSQPANQNQKKSSEKMQEMSESLQQSMMAMQSQQNQENIETLRQILENLKTLSFDVETLSEKSKSVNKNDPLFKDLLGEQKRLQDGSEIIRDSLTALAARAPQIEQIVFEELEKIDRNLENGIENLQELRNGQAAANQQFVMTSANELALLLDQSLQQMMQQQAQMMPGNQQCQKPGNKPGSKPGAKPSMQNVGKMQGELGSKMDRMKEGQKKGQGTPSKEIVEMMARQEQIRQGLEQMAAQEGKEGKEGEDGDGGNQGEKGNLQKAIEEMKKLEEDLLDGELGDNYKERLQEIETRLLEHEKAEREQQKDEKRESKIADDTNQLYQEELEKYLREKQGEQENLNRLPINFRNYYKEQTSKYLNEL